MTVVNKLHYQTETRRTIELEDGLIMRWSTTADTANIAKLLGEAFRWLFVGDPQPKDSVPVENEFVRSAARRLLGGKINVMSEYDYALVEDTRRDKGKNPIVACVSLHRLEGYYGSVDLTFGKPELIATDPEYRNRGLIRHLILDMVHPESDARGDVIQFIPGILHFYRQFGYEYSLMLSAGAKIENADTLPVLAKDQKEPFTLRRAVQADIPLLVSLSTPERLQMHTTIGLYYNEAFWQYIVHDAIADKQHRFDAERDTFIIVDSATGEDVGFTMMSHFFFGHRMEALAVKEGVLYSELTMPVFRQLTVLAKEREAELTRAREEALKEKKDKTDEKGEAAPAADAADAAEATTTPAPAPFPLSVGLYPQHPARILLGSKVTPPPSPGGFRLYTRIASYSKFLLKVAPELERRLAATPAVAGLTALVRFDFFRKVEGSSGKGLELEFNKGKLVRASDAWVKLSPEEDLNERLQWKKENKTPLVLAAAFPPLVFSNLVTGKNSLEELIYAYGDVAVPDPMTRLVLNALFPKVDHHMDIMYW
ncbi:hypothetical protein BGZ94_007183 [Podila epigama]|nr:hypothetical protein BGZ94_007183 [Podila epigama]